MPEYQVTKRNGTQVPFDLSKIKNAMARAFESKNKPVPDDILEALALRAFADAQEKATLGNPPTIHVETIQDSVEKILSENGYFDIAKAYILYRNRHANIRDTKTTLLNYKNVVDNYLNINDWRVKENSTVSYSLGGLILGNSGAVTANYWLSEVYDEEIAKAHRDVRMHIHDLSMLSGYCAGWNLKQLIQTGIQGVGGRISSKPASHLSTLCNQMVNFLGILQNEWAGAQAFSSFDTYLAPFVKADNLSQKEVKQCIQSFVFGVNTPSRWGCVTPDTEVLTVNGFKTMDTLQKNDLIYTWKDGQLELNPVREIVKKPHKGKLHSYKTKNYEQTVTPEHRVLIRHHNSDETSIRQSQDIFNVQTPYALPVSFTSSDINNPNLNEDLITLAAMVYTDGSFDYRNGNLHKVTISKSPNRFGNAELIAAAKALNLEFTLINNNGAYGPVNSYVFYGDSAKFIESLCEGKNRIADKFLSMNMQQANLFLNIWSSFDGDEQKRLCQYDNNVIRDQLQQIALLAGHCSYLKTRTLPSGHITNYVKIRQVDSIYPTERTETDYDGMVWCPNVENGTAVFRSKDGSIFISGQCQAPFTNVTIDWTCPDDLKNLPAIVGGKEMSFTYGDCKKEMDMVNKAFIEVMIEGDSNGRGFQYPIPTYSITKDFDWSETENNKLLFEMTAKYGIPYFSNYVNSDMEPSDIRSMCCRLRLDLRELRRKSGGFFGAGESTGSIGVVTLNMPRLAYESKSEADFYEKLDKLMDIAARSLKTKRTTISALLENGLYPYTKAYLGNFDNHFSTIGLVGMNEAGLNACWLRKDMTHPETQEFTKQVLNHMRERLSDYQEMYGDLYNLEATPAESTAYRFAKHDREVYPDIITANMNGTPYYTNSSHLPVGYTEDIFSALDVQDELQTLYTSGTVFHGFIGEKLPTWQSAMQLVRKIAENYKLPYYTLSPTYSVCTEHGYLTGEQTKCPYCGKTTEVYSRITGYYRAVQNWNDGKAQEFKDRQTYDIGTSFKKHANPPKPICDTDLNGTCPINLKPKTPDKSGKKLMLFTTSTCPKCVMAKKFLADAGIQYETVVVDHDPEPARKYNVRQAPTLLVLENEVEIQRVENPSNIRAFAEQQK